MVQITLSVAFVLAAAAIAPAVALPYPLHQQGSEGGMHPHRQHRHVRGPEGHNRYSGGRAMRRHRLIGSDLAHPPSEVPSGAPPALSLREYVDEVEARAEQEPAQLSSSTSEEHKPIPHKSMGNHAHNHAHKQPLHKGTGGQRTVRHGKVHAAEHKDHGKHSASFTRNGKVNAHQVVVHGEVDSAAPNGTEPKVGKAYKRHVRPHSTNSAQSNPVTAPLATREYAENYDLFERSFDDLEFDARDFEFVDEVEAREEQVPAPVHTSTPVAPELPTATMVPQLPGSTPEDHKNVPPPSKSSRRTRRQPHHPQKGGKRRGVVSPKKVNGRNSVDHGTVSKGKVAAHKAHVKQPSTKSARSNTVTPLVTREYAEDYDLFERSFDDLEFDARDFEDLDLD